MSRRDVSKPMRMLRELLLGRELKTRHRFQADMSPRPGPPPVFPEASFTKISANYYYLKDARRDFAPPLSITTGTGKVLIADPSDKSTPPPASKRGSIRPGKPYHWDEAE